MIDTMIRFLALPIDITELAFSSAILHGNCYVERPASRNRAAYPRHGDYRDVVESYVRGWFWDEHEALVQAEEMTFVRFDATLDARLLMMTGEVSLIIVARFLFTDLTKSFDGVTIFLPAKPRNT